MYYVTKILPIGVALFRADRQTDMTSLMVAFRNCFLKVPDSSACLSVCATRSPENDTIDREHKLSSIRPVCITPPSASFSEVKHQ
jgi:hypothetical protein